MVALIPRLPCGQVQVASCCCRAPFCCLSTSSCLDRSALCRAYCSDCETRPSSFSCEVIQRHSVIRLVLRA